MKRNKKNFLLTILILIPLLILTLFYTGHLQAPDQTKVPTATNITTIPDAVTKQIEKEEIPIKVIVGDHVGVDVTKEYLSFGMMPPGNSAKRWMNFENIVDAPCRVHLEVDGNLSGCVYFPENDFLLKKNQTKRLEIEMKIPPSMAFGTYHDTLELSFIRPP